MEIWRPAYIGLGSNLAGPRVQVLTARERLAGIPRTRVLLSSPLYRSRPLGPVAQPDFIASSAIRRSWEVIPAVASHTTSATSARSAARRERSPV